MEYSDGRFGAERILAATVAQSTEADSVTRLSLGVSRCFAPNPFLEEMDRLPEASPTILLYPDEGSAPPQASTRLATDGRDRRGFGRRCDAPLQIMRLGDTNRHQPAQHPIDPRARRVPRFEQSRIFDNARLKPLHDAATDARRDPQLR